MDTKKITEKVIKKLLALHPYPKNEDYYCAAKNWYGEVYESMICSRDRYRLLALVLGLLLTISILTIAGLVPLKKYYYRLITVNQQSGEVTQLKELEAGDFTANWAVTRYFLNQYIQYRNSYAYEDINRTFNIVLAMSDKKMADVYSAEIMDSNPKSPINILGKNIFREVTVFSINQLNNKTALVRFKTLTRDRNNLQESKEENYQAVVKWEYRNISASLEDRDKNPLGFTINYYQVSPVLPEN